MQDLPGASFTVPEGMFEERSAPSPAAPAPPTRPPPAARRLWTLSEERTGTAFARADDVPRP
ncbi:hypothetical protein [Streptomyces sp. NPDC127084]|uniref:hypothetical protein n=1 Tax=Streptomyces sp. NPDC127084 TaxID=3347133 RepID=UPI00364FC301